MITQAQIEAAISHDEAKEIASRLIAGAFRREDKRPQFSIPANPERDDDLRIMAYIEQQAALTAAFQVGGQDECSEAPDASTKDFYGSRRVTLTYQEYDLLTLKKEQIEAATIERCAQVAEQMVYKVHGQQIAAAIRKLKIDPNLIYPGKDPDFTFPEE